MSELFYRPIEAGALQLREGGDGRTIDARLVPYNTPTVIHARLTEEFLPGAFRSQMKNPSAIRLFNGHGPHGGKLIGRMTELREMPDGLYGSARISAIRDGDEALELLRDGVLDSVSIGFREGRNVMRNGVTQRQSATLTEVAIVLEPAYQQAKVLAMRDAETRETIDLDALLREINRPLPGLDPGVL